MLAKLFKQILRRKLIVGMVLSLIITGSYFGYQKLTKDDGATRYVTAAVEKGTLIVSLSGSGQVSASDQVDIKPKVSGDVIYVGVKNGQEVKVGTLLIQIDSNDTQKAVRDAQTSLETANLELNKLLEPIDELDLLKAENNLAKAKESKQKAEDKIIEGYEDAFNTMANAFLDLPTLITGLRDILYNYEIAKSEIILNDYQSNDSVYKNSFSSEDRNKLNPFLNSAKDDYSIARENYDQNFENYKNASRYSEKEIIESLLEETMKTTKSIAETVKSETNLLDFVADYFSNNDRRVYNKITEYQSDIKSYTSKTNSHLISLLNIQRSLQDNREAVLNAQRSIEELELSLAELKAGVDKLDIRAKEISIQQKEDALLDAQQGLADHYIRAPFDGIVASIDVKKGESISSNAIATLITKQKIAEISLNEIDIAQIKTGQKVNITFDAVDGLNITGEVIEVDAIGTVAQGVVTYNVKIAFDTQDERIKPGMSLSAAVITDVKQDVLLVQSSAIKQQGDTIYVQVADNAVIESNQAAANISGAIMPVSSLRTQQVQVGLANDTMTEILDGLEEGDVVVTQTITSNSTKNQSQQNIGGSQVLGGMMKKMR